MVNMLTWNQWICTLLLACSIVSSAVAKSKHAGGVNATAETEPTATIQSAPNARSNLAPLNGGANVTALLGVLVMKGVLTPSEANAIRNAPYDTEFQMLVDVLARKGVVTATDLVPLTSSGP